MALWRINSPVMKICLIIHKTFSEFFRTSVGDTIAATRASIKRSPVLLWMIERLAVGTHLDLGVPGARADLRFVGYKLSLF